MNGEEGAGKRIGPWIRGGSREVYENPWIRVREDAVTRPDGSPGIYGVVEFRNLTAAIVALNDDDEVVLVGQHRYPLDYYSWEIPEGGCPREENDPRKGAARELREETGLEAARWDYLGCAVLSNAATDETAHFFLARDLTRHEPNPEPTEVLRTRWLSLKTACADALEGRITDSLSMVGMLRAAHFLDRERNGLAPSDYPNRP